MPEARYAEEVIDSLSEPLLVLTAHLRVKQANKRFCEVFGLLPEEIKGQQFYEIGGGQWAIPDLRRLLETMLSKKEGFNDFEIEHDFEQIGRRVLLLSARRLNNNHFSLLLKDITKRHEAETALRKSEARFRNMANTVPDVLFTTTPVGVVTYVNERIKTYTGQSLETIIGTRMWPDLIHSDDLERTRMAWKRAYAEQNPFDIEYRFLMADGSYCWFFMRARPIRNEENTLVQWFGTLTEVDKLIRTEKELQRVNAVLQAEVAERTAQVHTLMKSVTLAEDDERRRIAQILHDDLQQLLFGLNMMLNSLPDSTSEAEMRQVQMEANEALTEAIELTRSLSVELNPPVLRSSNLEEMLYWLAIWKEKKHGLIIKVTIEGEVRISERSIRLLLYQILKEVLFNIVKHAGVRQARISSWQTKDAVIIRVEDDGVGFDMGSLDAFAINKGIGLYNVRERLEIIGGRFEIESAAGQGTRVTLVVPIRSETSASAGDC